ncbi:O-antigen ligase family protein [Mycolicibacterium vaccae]|uniref:O-antigen ligase family protein n=1 Tax=Mycolicibacterium vaccae TaxID=1810 RepID=UPI003D03301C
MRKEAHTRTGELVAPAGPDGDFLNHGQTLSQGTYRLGILYVFSSISLGLHFLNGPTANLLLLATLFALIVHKPAVASTTTMKAQDWAYIGYLVFIFMSALWSMSAPVTVFEAAPLVVPWVAALLLHQLPVDWVARVVVRFALAGALLAPLIMMLNQRLAYQPNSSTGAPELRGIFSHQLFFGAFLTLALGLIAVAYLNGRVTYVVGRSVYARIFVVATLLLALGLSRTRLYVAVGVFCVVLTYLLAKSGSRRWLSLVLLSAFGLVLYSTFGAIMRYLEGIGFDTSLTGRTYVWGRTLSAITEDSRLLGHGFGTFELSDFDQLFGAYRPAHAHSSYVQAYFETGLVGLVLVLVLIGVQLGVAYRHSVESDRYSYSLFLVLYCAFGSLTGGLIYAGSLVTPFCLMMLFLAIESRRNPVRSRPPLLSARAGPTQ